MNNKFFSFLKFFIGWPLSLISLFFISKLVFSQSSQITSYIKIPTIPFLISGIACFVIYYCLRTFLWKYLLKHKGYYLSYKESALLWTLAELKRYIPGNIWSMVGKTLSFGDKGVDKKIIAKLIITEAGFFVTGCLILSLLSLDFIFSNLIYASYLLKIFIFLIVGILSFFFVFNNKIFPKSQNRIVKFLKFFLPDFDSYTNFIALITSVLFLFFYGLGYFLIISSVVYLPLNQSISIISFFIFSLLVGYLSIITPMGLGVREGVVTAGLSKFLSVPLAGFSSIFARICLIISEFIFTIFLLIWKFSKPKRIEQFISKNSHKIILVGFILLYILYFTSISFLRYDNFFTGRFDLGNMDQTVWNTIHGRIFQLTDPNGTNSISRLAFHADFILILISPLYFIWSNPKILLLFQSVVLASGAFFLYLLSNDILKNKNISLAFAFSYLLNPLIQYANLYDFHPVTLATTFLLGSFYFMRKGKYLWFLAFMTLAAICKEEIWVIASIFGVYLFFVNKKKLLGSFIFIFSLFIFYFLVSNAIPLARGSAHFALSYYSDFGDSPTTIIKTLIFSPAKTVGILLSRDPFIYLFRLLLPVGGISLLSPLSLVFAVPDLLINLLSNNSQLREIYYQYTSTITPFIYVSSIYSIRFLTQKFSKIRITFFSWYLIFFALISAYFLGPLPLSRNPSISVFTEQLANRKEISKFLAHIPKKYSIAATNNLGSHLSRRQDIYIIPLGMENADIIAFLLNDKFAQPSLSAQKKFAQSLRRDKRYYLLYESGDFIAFKKRL